MTLGVEIAVLRLSYFALRAISTLALGVPATAILEAK